MSHDKELEAIMSAAEQKPYFKEFIKNIIALKPSKEDLKLATQYLLSIRG